MAVFIKPGDEPLSIRQATSRGISVLNQELGQAGARPGDERVFSVTPHDALPERLVDVLANLPGNPATYADYAAQWEKDNEQNSSINRFNHGLVMYGDAVARLARHRLADGRAELFEDRETGEIDDEGNPVTESVLVASAIDPLPAEVEQVVYSDAGEQTGTQMVSNPLVVEDDKERAAAQATIDQLPQSVIDFYSQASAE